MLGIVRCDAGFDMTDGFSRLHRMVVEAANFIRPGFVALIGRAQTSGGGDQHKDNEQDLETTAHGMPGLERSFTAGIRDAGIFPQ